MHTCLPTFAAHLPSAAWGGAAIDAGIHALLGASPLAKVALGDGFGRDLSAEGAHWERFRAELGAADGTAMLDVGKLYTESVLLLRAIAASDTSVEAAEVLTLAPATAGDLLDRLATAGAGLLEATLDGIEAGTLRAEPQSQDGVSYAGKLTVEDARVKWTDPAQAVDRHIRSVTPAPGAWTTFGDNRVKIGTARIADNSEVEAVGLDEPLAPGQLCWGKRVFLVGTASTPIVVEKLQPPGKKMMNALDWARGARLVEGAVFG